MPQSDMYLVLRWWGTLFLVGAAAFPLTRRLFPRWYDEGYWFAKATGMVVVSWIVYILGMARIAPFQEITVYSTIIGVFVVGLVLQSTSKARVPASEDWKPKAALIVVEELVFFFALLYWSFIKAHEPSIRGLEKFMDYGFMQAILNSSYFPPADMWYPPLPINYYYFGHLVTALLTKISGLDLAVTFNLMLASIFALCLTMSYSIGYQLLIRSQFTAHRKKIIVVSGAVLTAFLVTLAGNMQTLYAFTKGYIGENVEPFWQLFWKWGEFWQSLPQGLERYWYANATRFIPFTIHEFPSYSFVVSDIHGHVLSIPFVLLALGLLLVTFGVVPHENKDRGHGLIMDHDWLRFGFYGFLCGVLLMTNALDGPIYMGLFLVLYFVYQYKHLLQWKRRWKSIALHLGVVMGSAGLASFPFLMHFKSFVNGIAVNCPLPFIANSKIGPVIFEGVEKCQRSPLWMMWLLWGFFWFCGGMLVILRMRIGKNHRVSQIGRYRFISTVRSIFRNLRFEFTQIDVVLMVMFIFSVFLVVFAEFFYFKDIYPQHFRSNTMFKLGYQAFIMWSIVSSYAIVQFLSAGKSLAGVFSSRIARTLVIVFLIPQIFLVSIYPLFSVRSYFGGLKNYEGIYGLAWLAREYPDDYIALLWLKGQMRSVLTAPPTGRPGTGRATTTNIPVIVEADGDSYTDYQRFSVFTGAPTIIGWAVHEWLWRGTYDVVSPRREEVRKLYESEDLEETRAIIDAYGVRYIVVGVIERQKFTELQEWKMSEIASEVFRSNETVIYETTGR